MQGVDNRVRPTPVLGKAPIAAVLGLLALLLALPLPIAGVPLAVAAVVISVRARREIKDSEGELAGFGFSLTGFLLGAGVLIFAFVVFAAPYLLTAAFLLFGRG